ncbi:MAG: hypothetical protein U0136_02455 [Bdellovibrionota bacterium]
MSPPRQTIHMLNGASTGRLPGIFGAILRVRDRALLLGDRSKARLENLGWKFAFGNRSPYECSTVNHRAIRGGWKGSGEEHSHSVSIAEELERFEGATEARADMNAGRRALNRLSGTTGANVRV